MKMVMDTTGLMIFLLTTLFVDGKISLPEYIEQLDVKIEFLNTYIDEL